MTAEHSVTTPLPDTGLMLVGMGPGRLSGMSLEALNAAKTADVRMLNGLILEWRESCLFFALPSHKPLLQLSRLAFAGDSDYRYPNTLSLQWLSFL